MSATQWIPACAGMTIEKNLKIKNLKTCHPGARGLHPPTKTDVFAGPRPRDDKKGELCSAGPGLLGMRFFRGKGNKGEMRKNFLVMFLIFR